MCLRCESKGLVSKAYGPVVQYLFCIHGSCLRPTRRNLGYKLLKSWVSTAKLLYSALRDLSNIRIFYLGALFPLSTHSRFPGRLLWEVFVRRFALKFSVLLSVSEGCESKENVWQMVYKKVKVMVCNLYSFCTDTFNIKFLFLEMNSQKLCSSQKCGV